MGNVKINVPINQHSTLIILIFQLRTLCTCQFLETARSCSIATVIQCHRPSYLILVESFSCIHALLTAVSYHRNVHIDHACNSDLISHPHNHTITRIKLKKDLQSATISLLVTVSLYKSSCTSTAYNEVVINSFKKFQTVMHNYRYWR